MFVQLVHTTGYTKTNKFISIFIATSVGKMGHLRFCSFDWDLLEL